MDHGWEMGDNPLGESRVQSKAAGLDDLGGIIPPTYREPIDELVALALALSGYCV